MGIVAATRSATYAGSALFASGSNANSSSNAKASSAAKVFRHMALRIGLPLVVYGVVLHATSTSTISRYDGTQIYPAKRRYRKPLVWNRGDAVA